MIAEGNLNNALYALNAVLVHARTMAFEHVPHETLAKVLDIAELLPMLVARKDDTTEEFRSHLEGLVEISSGFMHALQCFDDSIPK
jgi:hypothetical protein